MVDKSSDHDDGLGRLLTRADRLLAPIEDALNLLSGLNLFVLHKLGRLFHASLATCRHTTSS